MSVDGSGVTIGNNPGYESCPAVVELSFPFPFPYHVSFSSIDIPPKTSLFPNSGGIKEFLPVNYDFLFNQFDYQDFTNKLNKLNEDDIRNRNSQKAKEFIRAKLDPQILITKFNEIILNDE